MWNVKWTNNLQGLATPTQLAYALNLCNFLPQRVRWTCSIALTSEPGVFVLQANSYFMSWGVTSSHCIASYSSYPFNGRCPSPLQVCVISQGKIPWNSPPGVGIEPAGYRGDRKWTSFVLPLSYHDPGMERTDSEIHSFSHWAIMTRATGRTDSEIHSFSHWAIMTRPQRGQTVPFFNSLTELSWLTAPYQMLTGKKTRR